MSDNSKVAMALIGGYVLGRTKKGKAAIRLALWLSGKGSAVQPQALARGGVGKLLQNPEVAQLAEQLRGPVVAEAQRLVREALEARLNGIADALQERTKSLQAVGGAATGAAGAATGAATGAAGAATGTAGQAAGQATEAAGQATGTAGQAAGTATQAAGTVTGAAGKLTGQNSAGNSQEGGGDQQGGGDRAGAGEGTGAQESGGAQEGGGSQESGGSQASGGSQENVPVTTGGGGGGGSAPREPAESA
ncbi:hypothetical protein [Geodermatophilus ruber]|uniref:Uncharacterized protein n=1 Tax=Geodermatophilus ruber TaxID=504800 RepID=A0A1I4GSG6_9ACTN|nr:hypothetical protein [Geodermatophilus ruber]SFL32056.1 hypothetical protein SAMN04488085_109122 [Geodermatophilus ruber]